MRSPHLRSVVATPMHPGRQPDLPPGQRQDRKNTPPAHCETMERLQLPPAVPGCARASFGFLAFLDQTQVSDPFPSRPDAHETRYENVRFSIHRGCGETRTQAKPIQQRLRILASSRFSRLRRRIPFSQDGRPSTTSDPQGCPPPSRGRPSTPPNGGTAGTPTCPPFPMNFSRPSGMCVVEPRFSPPRSRACFQRAPRSSPTPLLPFLFAA